MLAVWLQFQGLSAELFSKLMASLPGSQLFQLLILSAILGVVLVWLYRFVSFQAKLAALKRRIATIALEPFVFSDSARISIFTPLKLLALSAKYLFLSLPALLILAGPVVWILGLLNQVVGYDQLTLGQEMIVNVRAESSRDIRQLQISMEGEGFEITPLVRSFPDAQAWLAMRSIDAKPANAILNIKVADSSLRLPIYASPVLPRLTSGFWERLLFPGAQLKLPAGLKEISVDYPVRSFEIFGANMPWVLVFLVVSMFSGLIFAKFLNIQI